MKSVDSDLGNPSPLLYKDLIFVICSRGEINVLDATSGELKYKQRISEVAACLASPWVFDNKIHFIDEKGITRVFGTGTQFNLINVNKLDYKIWGSVAIAGDLYIGWKGNVGICHSCRDRHGSEFSNYGC